MTFINKDIKGFRQIRILPIPKSYTFLHRLLTRTPLRSDSWSFLHFPESQISHKWLSDHLSSWNECKAEFRNLCTSGITRKCRNSWSFLPIPELQISHPHTLILTLILTHTLTFTPHPHPQIGRSRQEFLVIPQPYNSGIPKQNFIFISIARFS
jgi:hypothetical protein